MKNSDGNKAIAVRADRGLKSSQPTRRGVLADAALGNRYTPHRRRRLAVITLAITLIVGVFAAPASTGAWFTNGRKVVNNSMSSASLQAVAGLTAKTAFNGVTISWTSALQQPWATSNNVSAEPAYTITKTVDGKTTTLSTSATTTTYTDAYPVAQSGKARNFDVGNKWAGYVKSDGSVWTWGFNTYGVGNGNQVANTPQQVLFQTSPQITTISMYDSTAVATATDGSFYAWGFNVNGGCDRNGADSPRQLRLPSNKSVKDAIAAGVCTIIAVDTDGKIWQRGGSSDSGTFSPSSTSFAPITLPGGRSVKQLTKAETVLATDGTVWSWGANKSGQLGDGTTTNSTTPVQAQTPVKISQISADTQSAVAIGEDGLIYGWGDNSTGQLAPSGSSSSVITTPTTVRVPQGHQWSDAQTRSGTTTIISSDDKSMWSVGKGSTGKLGNGTNPNVSTEFVRVNNSSSPAPRDIFVGTSQSYYVDSSDNLWGWGTASDKTYTFFGINDSTGNVFYLSPKRLQDSLSLKRGGGLAGCSSGTLNSENYCAPTGTAVYTVSYAFRSWVSSTAQATAQ